MSGIDLESQAVVEEIVRRESRSLLSYVGDAFPWTTAAGGPALTTLNQLIRQERQAVTDLGRHLVRRRVRPPFLGSYPASFTSWNFIDLGALLPRLVEVQRRSIGELQADLPKVHDAAAKLEVERLPAVKKRSLAGLESIPSPTRASA
ncbi:MAG: hypothetical protein U0797_11280 [Gemmataceae bacterium]